MENRAPRDYLQNIENKLQSINSNTGSDRTKSWSIKGELHDKFKENIIKSSPNFDQECWNRREAFKEIQKHNDELLENDKVKHANVPKCPTCQSINLKKITITSKAMNTALFGLFGTKRHKTFHCNSCGYEW